ncbi:MAG: uracil-DNA glycosylase [Piscirickettsiaceae bacterium CG_4_9_14_3_um_filter_43_564]|nr:MAG: uracil-DNA glycosylase [Piscirickettsiaceae bacterium CG18_big_fil_WC_8_21_14_2_50_44_103]PIU39484.1 MAG: uracil-DNA glycosylase [Piscirickettsiaceae bacterium CG07_land_8_20_14_0_80_44_28]PIW58571.1 MAG: uracil-DNA glycosylase [Piscirickettsiaceae bacterium CG12_big_fil_rev_8_21_14_0_65_44_934]PIW78430.1 MAG: uracil-DNA glycosylase [Piscirickettsiaceae bacterium CG_4_8_14_3_um_filter_44_38]PIX78532.1 MAG: uracil-DNA glycosylase [Piscirickettsiaceae bacterium CG_4_10_14_3_um_filter_44_3
MSKTNSSTPIDCFKCRHFYITWDANQPKGCKAFRFKTKFMPSTLVFETSGHDCLKFSPKTNQRKSSNNANGWIA